MDSIAKIFIKLYSVTEYEIQLKNVPGFWLLIKRCAKVDIMASIGLLDRRLTLGYPHSSKIMVQNILTCELRIQHRGNLLTLYAYDLKRKALVNYEIKREAMV